MSALRSVRSGMSTWRRSAARRVYRAAARVLGAAPESVVEPLETRVLMSTVNYAVPDGADHALTLGLVQVSGTPTLQLVDNGTVVATQGFAGVTSVSVTGGAGHDTLAVDFGGGSPIPTGAGTGGLTFAGGGPSNRLLLENGSISSETYRPTGASSGAINIDGGNLTYSNLGGITDLAPAANVAFFAAATTAAVNVVNGPVVGGVQTMEVNGGASPAFLTTDLANKQNVTVDTNTGDDTLTMDLTAASAHLSTLFLNTDQGADTVNILATPAGVSTSVNGQNPLNTAHGPDEITVGNAGSVQQIQGPLSLADDVWYDDITINDSADLLGRTFTYGHSSVTGLAPATISYNQNDIFTITVDAGAGGNNITVADTVVSSTNTLNTGSGNNTVVVQSVLGGSTLNIHGQGGHDSVTVDVSVLTQGSLAGFQSNLGPVTVTNPGGATALTIDASSESSNHSLTIASSWEIGLGSSSINYSLGAGSSLDVKTGSGNDTFRVNTTSVPTTLEGGAGANSYAVDLTGLAAGSPLTISDGGGGQATFGGAASAATYAIGPTQVSVAGALVNYAGLSQVTVNAIDGLDTFNVTPSASTTLNVNGGAPSGVTLNNTLNVQTTGATNVSLSQTSTSTGYQGSYTFGNRQPVNFKNIQLARQQQAASADLALSLTAPASVTENGALTYTFAVTNNGPGDAANVVVTDPLPAGATFQSASLGQGSYALVNGQLVLSLGAIANGATVRGTLTFLAGDDGATVSNTATVTSDTADPQTANNTASASTSVTDAALSVTGGFAVAASEGAASATQALATFTDPAGAEALADYSATINWGDGSSSAGTITYNASTGVFTVTGAHAYTEEGNYTAGVSVAHDSAAGAAASTSVVVKDLPPVPAPIVGPAAGVRGQDLSFTDAFTDAGVLDTHVASVNWGDGSKSAGTVKEANGSGTISASHVFTASGVYKVALTVTDDDGASATVYETVTVSAVLVEPDPVYGGTMLVIGGTTGADTIQVNATRAGSNLQVMLDGAKTNVPATVGRILVYGQAGNDYIQIGHNVVTPAFLYAGNGNDTLIGGGGPDVIVGGSGNDLLVGGSSRNILIGGAGSDVLIGGNADDILIAGYTAYDHNDAALAALFNEWNRATVSYAARVNDLMHGGGLNGSYVLNSKTVFNDHATDILVGNRGLDWFIFSTGDLILDQGPGEIATRV